MDMDCREFRENHTLFVDQMCSAVAEAEMRAHMQQCQSCSHHDMVIRRSLMLIRSLPSIELSPDFRMRLEARLRAVSPVRPTRRTLAVSYATFAALAAGVAFITLLAVDVARRSTATDIRLAPVVASVPDSEPSPVATSALMATVPTGMSVWPAIMVASQAPIHFVAAEMAAER